MSECLALEPSTTADERTSNPAPRRGFAALFKAALESLVTAQTRRFEDTEPLLYRFPPV